MLVREDNLRIIEEIRNLEKGALGDYIRKILAPLKNDNAVFYETLYKDILYVLRNVDESGDNDLVIENGNWPVFDADGKVKITGYQTRLHEILPSLHTYKANKVATDKPFIFGEEMKRFKKDFLDNKNYTPEYKEKLDKINSSIKKERHENYVLPRCINLTDTKPQQVPEPINIKEKIPATIIALFCVLINEAKIIERLAYDSVETYCTKVCNKYKLSYTDRVRQAFNGSKTIRNIEKLKKLILPNIDSDTCKILTEYIGNKNK